MSIWFLCLKDLSKTLLSLCLERSKRMFCHLPSFPPLNVSNERMFIKKEIMTTLMFVFDLAFWEISDLNFHLSSVVYQISLL